MKIAFQVMPTKLIPEMTYKGHHGAFSEEAIHSLVKASPLFNEDAPVMTFGFNTTHEAIQAVKDNKCQYAILPIENTVTGTFLATYDLLNDVYIAGEVCVKETLCLVGLPSVPLSQIKEIRSHPFAISQCQQFLSLHPTLQITQTHDTASSASEIKFESLQTTAAIASEKAATLNNLHIYKKDIQDAHSITRYVLISDVLNSVERQYSPKTSLSVVLKNQTGAFLKAIACFSLRDVSISKLESIPSSRTITLSTPWEYIIYIDVDGSVGDETLNLALNNLREFGKVKVLGCYPKFLPAVEKVVSTYGACM